jgi:anti-anti-sigma factor
MAEIKEISIEPHDQFILATLQCQNMDEDYTSDMLEKIPAAAARSPELPLILDMTQVEFFPSISLGALVTIMQTLKQNQQRFILINLHPDIRQTLTICRLDKFFEIFDTLEDAQTSLTA